MALSRIRVSAPSLSSLRRCIAAAVGLAALGFVASDSYFVVPQTDVAYVTRSGKILHSTEGPLQPGLHLKLPFFDIPVLILITTKSFERSGQTFTTQDVTLNYRMPASAAFRLLYELARTGSVDSGNVFQLYNEVMRELARTKMLLTGQDAERAGQ